MSLRGPKPRGSSIERTGIITIMVIALFRRTLRGALISVVSAVMRLFFLPQFRSLLDPTCSPVVNVDHPLDRRIPFVPGYVHVYLTFTHLWIKACHFLYRTFGSAAVPHVRDFVNGVSRLYRDAARVYTACQSTTSRPRLQGYYRLRLVRAVDPHLHCVPSLHVMIVVYTWYRMREIIRELGGGYETECDYLRRRAVAITESVLFVKQHSVNCVPTALFALTRSIAGFTPEMSEAFVDELFGEYPGGVGSDAHRSSTNASETRGGVAASTNAHGVNAAGLKARDCVPVTEIRAYMKRVHADLTATCPDDAGFEASVLRFLARRGRPVASGPVPWPAVADIPRQGREPAPGYIPVAAGESASEGEGVPSVPL